MLLTDEVNHGFGNLAARASSSNFFVRLHDFSTCVEPTG
jgi:hypothetical protein